MLYRTHHGGAPGVKPSFGIAVDDETMRWTSEPAGHDLEQPLIGVYLSRGGPPGSGKVFDLFPGGEVRNSRVVSLSAHAALPAYRFFGCETMASYPVVVRLV